MKITKSTLIGMLVLAIGGIAVGLLFFHPPTAAEEEEESIETVVPVQVGQIIKTTLHDYETGYGHIDAVPPGLGSAGGKVAVGAMIDGTLVRATCAAGQGVKKGDVLFELDTRAAEIAVNEQRQNLEFAQNEYDRQGQLLDIEGTSEREFQQAARALQQAEQALAAAELQLEFHTIRAPIDGTVTAVSANVGDTVQSAQVLAEILDTNRRIVSIQLPAASIDRIESGMPTQLEVDGDWIDAGKIDYIAETVDPGNGTVELRATLPPSVTLHIGQFVRARILCETHTDCLAVPVAALVTDPEGESYIALIAEGSASRKAVVGELRENGWVEIVAEGIAEGMKIAVEGVYGLPEETRIEVMER
ncbi:MAG: efflux RND transporter periplasmic adaptor subunit [Pontiellaceae bacterium]|nr:efflux RND transporter periplasmic adaptor subunit [Pontiellaceae bacterium]